MNSYFVFKENEFRDISIPLFNKGRQYDIRTNQIINPKD